MDKLSEQKIVIYCDFEDPAAGVVIHGLRIARIFKKELCLFRMLRTNDKNERPQAQKKLENMIRLIRDQTEGIPVSSLTLKGNLADATDRIAEDYDGILMILTKENMELKLSVLQQSQIPFLFVGENNSAGPRYDHVLLPVDSRKANKNSSLWASYFCRFNHSSLDVLIADEKNPERKKQIGRNLTFVKRLFSNLSLEFQLSHSNSDRFRLPQEALTRCRNEMLNLIILVSEWQPGSEDPFPDEEIIKQADMPVLLINPNRDMYILCD